MNILLFRWGAYTEPDLEVEFKKAGNKVDVLIYKLLDKHNDEAFENELKKKLTGYFDFVFSVNYFPVIAKVCHKKNVKYISWSYDAPLNVTNIEDTLGLPCNYVFMFDHDQVTKYRNKGFSNVYHLSLAVPVDRYASLISDNAGNNKFNAEISFVGNLYSDILSTYIAPLTDYMKGVINGLCTSQSLLYGCYFLDEVVNDRLIEDINKRYKEINPNTEIVMSREAMTYAMSSTITRQERIRILGILSLHHKLKYYCSEECDALKNAIYAGMCDYYNEMPLVFAGSRINLNITLKILTSGIPLRALDIMGCGGFLLSNYQPELAENFVNGKEVVLYDSIEDAYEKANYYLKHEDERTKICQNGYSKVKREYTYDCKLKELFDISNKL